MNSPPFSVCCSYEWGICALDSAPPTPTLAGMKIFTSPEPLAWGALDVPMFGLTHDLAGDPIEVAAGFSLVMDRQRLWFLANHRRPASIHPQARPGAFQAELWRYDVAEMFIADPATGRYFEFNLAPNGGWWSCEFTAPRVRADEADIAMPDVATFADMAPDGSWLVAMAIPLDLLRARLDFGPETRLNVTMILGSPEQKFLSASNLGDGPPDFHQPDRFEQVEFVELPENP